ncbi:MAG: hypothetical protein ACLUAB_11065, partial [Ruminococcus sp.]
QYQPLVLNAEYRLEMVSRGFDKRTVVWHAAAVSDRSRCFLVARVLQCYLSEYGTIERYDPEYVIVVGRKDHI